MKKSQNIIMIGFIIVIIVALIVTWILWSNDEPSDVNNEDTSHISEHETYRVTYEVIDKIVFGDEASEQGRGFNGELTVIDTNEYGIAHRRMLKDGFIEFELDVVPNEQNYLTLQLWGSETGDGLLLLTNVAGTPQLSQFGGAKPELDRLQQAPAFPDRFYYSTYILPQELVRDQEVISLKIESSGQATPYSSASKVAEQKDASRGIYSAATHTNPLYIPVDDAFIGSVPELGPAMQTKHAGMTHQEHIIQQTNRFVSTMMSWQLYGPEWEESVAAGEAPQMMTGAIVFGGGKGNSAWDERDWKNGMYQSAISRQNGENALAYWVFAEAYHQSWSDYYGDEQMIDRIVKGLDFYTVAQGHNGGFVEDRNNRWIGAPNRIASTNILEGFGTRGLGKALVMVYDQMLATGYLDELIDHDLDPETAEVTRAEAYSKMFAAHRDYIVTMGHAVNQVLANTVSFAWANEALKLLAPEMAWSDEQMRPHLYASAGYAPDRYGGVWFSEKGMPVEPNGTTSGGYTGDYNTKSVEFMIDLAALTQDEKLIQRAHEAMAVMSYYKYVGNDEHGHIALLGENVVNSRNNYMMPRPDYGGSLGAGAVELQIPAAIRMAQLYMEHQRGFSIEGNRVDVHYPTRALYAIELANHYDTIISMPKTEHRLPMESKEADFIWTDELAQAVVIKHDEARMYMSLNWRNSGGGTRMFENARNSDIARVHYTTPTIDRIANVAMESMHGYMQLSHAQYGDYLIYMNSSSVEAYDIDGPEGLNAALDLVSGEVINLAQPHTLPPLTTRVFYVGDKPFNK